MATLERRRSEDVAPAAVRVLDGTVPAPFDRAGLEYESDLIDLGQEQLFSGCTGGSARHALDVEAQTRSLQELLATLDAAQQTFLFALNGLLHQSFAESRLNSPVSARGSATLTPELERQLDPFLSAAPTLENPFPEQLTSEPDLLAVIVDSLRAGTEQLPVATYTATRAVDANGAERLMEELQSRVAMIAPTLSATDSELATSLGSLLSCISRLLTLCRPSATSLADSQPILDAGASNVYATLERQTRELQTNRSQWSMRGTDVVGAARAVELAEREFLWGRVDDLSERVAVLCRTRAQAVAESHAPFHDASPTRYSAGSTGAALDFMPPGDLPHYDADGAHPGLPPSYVDDAGVGDSKAPAEKSRTSEDGPGVAIRLTSPPRKAPVAGSPDKMQLDLDSVSTAIERLYKVSPQLANQRVEPDRRRMRERQLAKLGNAIERLSMGRLDDQRAVACPVQEEGPAERQRRMKVRDDTTLDCLIEQIDRAASRTLADQRADIDGKRREDVHSALRLQTSNLERLQGAVEAERRTYILEHLGKGRLSSQDASFSTSPSSATLFTDPFGSPSSLVAPMSMAEFFRTEHSPIRTRSASLPPVSTPLMKKLSTGLLQTFKKGSPTPSRRGSNADIYSADAESASVNASRTFRAGSTFRLDPSLPPAVAEIPIVYVVEEARNLGTLVVTFWSSASNAIPVVYSVVDVQALSLYVAPSSGGPASRIVLPSPIQPQEVKIVSRGTFYEIRLSSAPAASTSLLPTPPPQSSFTDIQSPLPTVELRRFMPRAYSCISCHNPLVDGAGVTKYNALPSEHWAELLDSWMCHGDQELSEDLIKKGKGIRPRQGEALVAAGYIVFEARCTHGWATRPSDEGTRTDTDDLLTSAYCSGCQALVGYLITSLSPDPTLPTYFRLLKYASSPTASLPTHAGSPSSLDGAATLRQYSLSTHLTAEMLEIGQAHACHRFIVEDVETETARLLLWLFNPAVRVSHSGNGSSSHTLNAVKTFYQIVDSDADPACEEFVDSAESTTERIAYPLAVIEQLCAVLQDSSALYPPEKRRFGPGGAAMHVGFLERL